MQPPSSTSTLQSQVTPCQAGTVRRCLLFAHSHKQALHHTTKSCLTFPRIHKQAVTHTLNVCLSTLGRKKDAIHPWAQASFLGIPETTAPLPFFPFLSSMPSFFPAPATEPSFSPRLWNSHTGLRPRHQFHHHLCNRYTDPRNLDQLTQIH
jgi:hypothetical protein